MIAIAYSARRVVVRRGNSVGAIPIGANARTGLSAGNCVVVIFKGLVQRLSILEEGRSEDGEGTVEMLQINLRR